MTLKNSTTSLLAKTNHKHLKITAPQTHKHTNTQTQEMHKDLKMKKLYLTLPLLFCLNMLVKSQDIHLSNYQPAGLLFNPARTALMDADIQFGVQYRNQWASIPSAYTTTGATAELKGKKTGFGLQVFQNKAGEASLKTTNLMLTGAYHKQLAREGTLSLGAGLGRLQKSFNPANFTYDSQYLEGEGYDATLSNGEFFQNTTRAITDFNIGLNWQGALNETGKSRGRLGLSLAHVQLPNESFLGGMAELPMKTVVQAGFDFRVDNRFSVSPDFIFQKQGVHREVVGGVAISAWMNPETKLRFGMAYRLKDAIIGQVSMDLDNKSIWLSYDATSSELQTATGGKGAWEIGLYLRFNRNKQKQMKDSDGDGVYDNRDKCPKVPGLPELQGCPEAPKESPKKEDTDGDGVTDDLDQCPLEPGLALFYGCNDRDRDGTYDHMDSCPELFGPPENKGCPTQTRDSDKDGIPDDEDYCVFLKGTREFHGCPDSDKDGISDIDDECPYLKGTRENDGCPFGNGTPAEAKYELDVVIVEFDTDQSYLKPEFRAMLDEFASKAGSIYAYRLMISGHTDSEGSNEYNFQLGQRRAEAVQGYLAAKGISFDKMTILSYGEAIPRRDNYSASGKARNRRTEVTLVRE